MSLTSAANAADYISMGENVALGKTAVASSGTASQAVDGDAGTRWESAQTDGEWFYVDLGDVYALDQLQIVWEGAYTKNYNVLVADEMTEAMSNALSDENADNDFSERWTIAATVNEDLAGFPYTYYLTLPADQKGRYVAIQCLERGTQWGNSFWEFRVMSYGKYDAAGSDEAARVFVENGLEAYTGETATVGVAAINGKNFRMADERPVLSCDNTSITIDGYNVTGSVAGTYTLTATASNNVSGTAQFIVRENARLASIEIAANTTIGSTGSSYEFTVTSKNQFGEDYPLTDSKWNAEGPGTATFDGNRMTVDSRGNYTVTLASGDVTSNAVTIEVVAEGANLALGKTVVSATEGSENPNYAVDGNDGNMWVTPEPAGATDHEYDAEIVIDLGSEFNINVVHTYWEGASSADYTVTFSTDGTTFSEPTEAFTMTNGAGMVNRHDWLRQNEAVSARYVKLHSTKAATQYGVKLREIEVYSNSEIVPVLSSIVLSADNTIGHLDTAYPVAVAFKAQTGEDYTLTDEEQAAGAWVVSGGQIVDNAFKATAKGSYTVKYKVGNIESNELTFNVVASGENILKGRTIVSQTEGATRGAAMAIDGDAGSDWFIKADDNSADFPAEFVVDFGANANIDAIHLNWEGANAAEYEILFSADGVTFTPWKSFSETPNVRARQDWLYEATTTQTRYVKLALSKAANGGYGYRLFEIEAYGENNDELSGVADLTVGGQIRLEGDCVVLPAIASKVCVYSLNGQLVAAGENTARLSVAGLQKGVYVVRAAGADSKVATAKIIK